MNERSNYFKDAVLFARILLFFTHIQLEINNFISSQITQGETIFKKSYLIASSAIGNIVINKSIF